MHSVFSLNVFTYFVGLVSKVFENIEATTRLEIFILRLIILHGMYIKNERGF